MKRPARAVAVAALLAIGLCSVTGAALETIAPAAGRALVKLGFLTVASPYPKVFCRVGDEEPFGFEHGLTLLYADGREATVTLDRARTSTWGAPYQHRNVVGAVLAFAPRLPRETTEAVLKYAFCGRDESLSAAMDPAVRLDPARPFEPPMRVRVTSRPIGQALGAERTMTVECSAMEVAQ